jgi:crotonobetainyl-CoA:carnitine CoA-transferase CaiB-like acyl-CoA transferase
VSANTLRSVRVVDLSSPVGTYCTRLLADLGADVVLVEPPEGDPYRRLGPFRAGVAGPDASLAFGYYQAGKRGVVLDLDDAADVAVLESLGGDADVVVISPSPSRPTPGFDAATGTLSWASADAIVCSVTPFGVTGPYARRPATHVTSFAQSGEMWRAGPAGTPPVPIPANLHWHIASAHAAVAILAALDVRDRAGGQFVDISAQEVEQYQDVLWEAYHFQALRPGGRTIPIGVPPTGVWQCRDGLFDVAAHQVQHWEAFLEMLDHPEELREPALADMTTRQQIFDGVSEVVAALLAPRSRNELFDRGQKVGLPVGLRNTPAQFVADEQLAARGFWIDLGRPETGPLPAPGPAVRTVPELFAPGAPAPLLDEHGSELRVETRRRRPRPERRGSEVPSRPLTGVRVLSLGEFVAGNYTAQILAALGAEVVKIESRSRPSVVRMQPFNDAPTLAVEPSGATNTPMYASFSRGMLGVAIEMATDEGRRVFRRLAAASDVVIENFGASVMANWGCAYDDLLEHNPQLVMASLSGYGRTGPRASYLAYGSNIVNFTGVGAVWWTNPTYGDFLTAAHAALAILAALRHAAATREGVLIDASQVEVVASMAASLYLSVLADGEHGADVERSGHDAGSLFRHVFSCTGDDRWAAVDVTTLQEWNAVCDVVERPDLRASTGEEAVARRGLLREAIDEWAGVRTPVSAAHLLSLANVPAASVANTEESYHDPQLLHRHFPSNVDHPDLGFMSSPGTPYRLSVTPAGSGAIGPRVGQHTREVLRRWTAMTDSDVDALVAAGVAYDLAAG